MKTIPTRIKIGGHWLEIKLRNRYEHGFDHVSSINHSAGVIFLNESLSLSKRWSCLIHEILHELDWQLDLDLKENQVSAIAEGLFQVLTDNEMWDIKKEGE